AAGVPGKIRHNRKMKLLLWLAFATVCLAQTPSTVIHIINIKWKDEATPEQIKNVVEAARQLPSKYPGLKRAWTETIRYQGQEGMKQAIVMEFESADALKKYSDSPAQKWWYEMYLPIREDSVTHDIGN